MLEISDIDFKIIVFTIFKEIKDKMENFEREQITIKMEIIQLKKHSN